MRRTNLDTPITVQLSGNKNEICIFYTNALDNMSNHQTIINQMCANVSIDGVRWLVLAFDQDFDFQIRFVNRLGPLTLAQRMNVIVDTRRILRERLDILAAQQWKYDNYARLSDTIRMMPRQTAAKYFAHMVDQKLSLPGCRAELYKIISDDYLCSNYEMLVSTRQFKQILRNYLAHPEEF